MKLVNIFIAIVILPLSSQAQIITTVAGNGIMGHNGDSGMATVAKISDPVALKFDKYGNYFFSEVSDCTIRKVNSTGIISTIAGIGSCGYNGDNILATSAKLNDPAGIAIDSFGNIYIADAANNRVRKIDITTGIITTIAGTGVAGFSGDGGLADTSKLSWPYDICISRTGILYISDFSNNRIRKIDNIGIITTVAGNGNTIFSGAGGLATLSGIGEVLGVCTDTFGNLFLAARSVTRILKVDTLGILSIIAGDGLGYNTGDGGPAIDAQIDPERLAFDEYGNLYISCIYKYSIRKIDAFGIIHTIVGIDTTAGYSGDGGLADTAKLDDPQGIAFDACGNLYIADEINYRIRKVTFDTSCIPHSAETPLFSTHNESIACFPNPVTTSITITSGDKINCITIRNIVGEQVVTHPLPLPSETVTIDISMLPLGVYLVRVVDEAGTQTVKKIVKE